MSLSYFPLYPKDFLGATGRLNAEKFGIYTRLLYTSWFEPLNDDIEELAFLVGSTEGTTQQILDRYFVLTNGVWLNPRLEKERCKAETKHKKAVESGKKGAEIRWGEDSDPNSDPNRNPNSRDDNKTIATQNSEPRTKELKTDNSELSNIIDYFPFGFFKNVTIPNLLLNIKNDFGNDALRAMCEKVAMLEPKKLNAPYVKAIIENMDLSGIAKGVVDESGNKREWLCRVQAVSEAENHKSGKSTDELFRALKDNNGNNIKFPEGHKFENQSVWVKK